MALTHQTQDNPLLLFRKTSFTAIDTLISEQKKSNPNVTEAFSMSDFYSEAVKKAAIAAKKTWGDLSPTSHSYPECQDPTLKTLYRGSTPFLQPGRIQDFDDEFFEHSLQLWLPILLNMEEGDSA